MTPQEYEALVLECSPHPVFSTEWGAYEAMDFANTFLPKVKGYKGKRNYLFDGTKLFEKIVKVPAKVYDLEKDIGEVFVYFYTYPEAALAAAKKQTVVPKANQILLFAEVNERGDYTVYSRMGRRIQDYVKRAREKKGLPVGNLTGLSVGYRMPDNRENEPQVA